MTAVLQYKATGVDILLLLPANRLFRRNAESSCEASD